MSERVIKTKLLATVTDYENGMLAAARATRQVGTEAEKLEQKRQAFDQLGRGLVLTGTALTAVTALSIKAAIDWETAWAGVTKTVDGNAEQMGVLEDGLRSLAQTLPATHDEIAAVAEAAGQLGVARESVVDFTKTMIDLSETTNLSADEAATSIAQFMNVMQTAPDDVDNLGAALVALGNDGASTERDIIQMAQRIAGAGKIVGLTEPQVLGFANALASVGIEAEAGGSSISRIMTDIAMSVSEGGEKLDQFAKVAGMSSADFQKAFEQDPANAIATFVEGLGRINDSGGDVFKTLSDLGQTDIRVSQALLGMANSGDLLRESLELGSLAWDENTALAVEAAKRYETTEAKIQVAGNAVRDAAIDFGQVFLPAVAAASEGVADFAGFIGDLPDPMQGLLGILTSVVGVVALTGGAALLAVPKIAEFKVALETLNISMRGVAIVGGGAIIALTALVTVVGIVASAQAEAEQKAQSYADTLAEGTQKVTKATREMIAETLTADQAFLWISQGSLADNAETLGLSITTVTDAIAGNADALDEVNAALKRGIDEGYKPSKDANLELYDAALLLQAGIEGEVGALDKAAEKARQTEEATRESASATDVATMSTEDFEAATQEAVGTLDEMIDALLKVADGSLSMAEAHDGALSAVNALVEAAEAEGVSLDGTNDASIRFRDTIRDVESAHRDSAAAILENGGTLGDARAEWEAGREKVIEMRTAMGESREEAIAWADQNLGSASEVVAAMSNVTNAVNGIPAARSIDLSITGTSAVYNELMRVQDALQAVTGDRSLHVSTGQGGQGGLVAGNETGNLYTYRAFADGGLASGIYPGGAEIHKFAEKTLPWEAYISPKADQRQKNYGVWMEAGSRLGFLGGQQDSGKPATVVEQHFHLQPGLGPDDVRRIARERETAAVGSA